MKLLPLLPETRIGIRLKDGQTFFAAGDSFEQASLMLSDGAFRLFAHLCLRADRRTGRYETTMKQLATTLKKSRRIIGAYAAEVRSKGLCKIQMGSNQFAQSVIEICDAYWPYVRSDSNMPSLRRIGDLLSAADDPYDGIPRGDRAKYLQRIRDTFMSLGCTRGIFRATDRIIAEGFFDRGILCEVVCDALVMGAVRKYCSWLNGGISVPISSLKYFEAVVDELLHNPLPPGYSEYIREKLDQLRELWMNRQ